jgi:AraC-like DNA-binding protein
MKPAFNPFCTALYSSNETASIFYSSHITPLHYHNAVQLVVDLKNKFLFRIGGSEWKQYKSLVIKENVAHQLNTNDSLQLIIYIDAVSATAKKISDKYLKDRDVFDPEITFSPVEEILFHQNLVKPNKRSLQLLIELILNRLTDLTPEIAADERITKVLELIKRTDVADLSIQYLAAKVFISPSRLRMQFKQKVGISLHNCIIRYKLLSAITEIINGSSIKDASYKTGFNDSSHFNKLMLKTFGINPSSFLRENKNFSIIREDKSFKLETRSPALV